MKTSLKVLVLLVLLVGLVAMTGITTSAETSANGFVRYCEYCDLVETWQLITTAEAQDTTFKLTSGHYYISGDLVAGKKTISGGNTVCLELNGKNWLGNRHIVVESGAVLNVQDSAGGGVLSGRGSDLKTDGTHDPGRVVWLKAGGELNLYSGTMTAATSTTRNASRGGVVGIYGTFNMYGGKVCDGIAKELGGTLFLDTNGRFNMYGGTVSGGSALNSPCCYFRGRVLLVNDASIEHAQITPNTNQGLLVSDQLTIRGKYTGSACLSVLDVSQPGMDVGNSDNADLTDAHVYLTNNDLLVKVEGTELVTYQLPAAQIEGGEAYDTLAGALAAVKPGQTIRMGRSVDESVTVSVDGITIDLQGHDIRGTLTAAEGVTVYMMDSYTADYSVADGMYGKVTAVAGNVLPAPATEETDVYLPVADTEGISYHAVGLNISSMSIKPGEGALYFNNDFKGDAVVAPLVESFGIAMSVSGAPDASTMENPKHFTSFDKSEFGGAATSSLLSGILKSENNRRTNIRNADTTVFARAYVKLTDGSYLFGVTRQRSLAEQLDLANQSLSGLTALQKNGLVKFYNAFADVLSHWNLDKIKDYAEHHEENTLKIIVLGNSHSVDAFQLLYETFQAENPEQEIVLGLMYYSGCTISQHVQFGTNDSAVYSYRINADGTWVYHDGATLRDGLRDQQWDMVFIQGNRADLDGTMNQKKREQLEALVAENVAPGYELAWHNTWPSPNDEIFFSEGYDPQPPAGFKDTLTNLFGFDPYNQLRIMNENIINNIVNNPKYTKFVSIGPAILYAHGTLGAESTQLWRDYTHLNDFGRVIAAYCWYSQLSGEPITEVNMDMVPAALRHRRAQAYGDLILTEDMKQMIIESANYALDNKWSVPEKPKEADPSKDDELNVFFISNSTCCYFPDELYGMLEAEGYKNVTLAVVYYSGCSVKQHYEWYMSDTAGYEFRVWDQRGETRITDYSLRQALAYKNWDIISFDSNARSFASGDIETSLSVCEPYFSQLLPLVQQHQPKARYFWHEVWANEIGYNLAFNMETIEQRNAVYNAKRGVAKHMEATYGVEVVPTGDAWEPVRDLPLFTTPIEGVGADRFTLCSRNSYNSFKDDFTHDGDIGGGQYLNACVWFEKITGKSCLDNTFRPRYELKGIDCSLTEEKITILKNAAHNAVENWDDPANDDTLYILTAAASNSHYFMDELYGVLEAAGIKAKVCNLMRSSTGINLFHQYWKNDEKVFQLIIHDENGKTVIENMGVDDALAYYNWDVFNMQEGTSPHRTVTPQVAAEQRYTAHKELIAHIREVLPKAELYYQEIWSYDIGFDRFEYQMTSKEQQLDFSARIKEYTDIVCNEFDLKTIPCGSAWVIARENPLADHMCARLSYNNGEGDYYHDGDIGGGQYLNACVWLETLSGESCIGNTFRPDYTLSEELIEVLQQAAHQAVANMRAE